MHEEGAHDESAHDESAHDAGAHDEGAHDEGARENWADDGGAHDGSAAPAAFPAQGAAAAAAIVGAVQEALAQGRLAGGTRLREEALAQVFGCSRTAVRDALRVLAERGVVFILPNRGATVSDPTPEEVRQSSAARALIAGAMAAELAQHITAADIRRLRDHLARQRETLARGALSEHLRLMAEFHHVLAALHGNVVLAELLDRVVARTSLAHALHPPEHHGCAVEGHAALIEALAAGDAEAARRLAEGHLMANLSRLRRADRAAPLRGLEAALRP